MGPYPTHEHLAQLCWEKYHRVDMGPFPYEQRVGSTRQTMTAHTAHSTAFMCTCCPTQQTPFQYNETLGKPLALAELSATPCTATTSKGVAIRWRRSQPS